MSELYLRKEIEQQDAKDNEQDANAIVPWSRVTIPAATNATGVLTALTFKNLEAGKWYQVTGQIKLEANEFNSNAKRYTAVHEQGAANVMNYEWSASNVFEFKQTQGVSFKFQSNGNDLTFRVVTADNTALQAGFASTFFEIEEVDATRRPLSSKYN